MVSEGKGIISRSLSAVFFIAHQMKTFKIIFVLQMTITVSVT